MLNTTIRESVLPMEETAASTEVSVYVEGESPQLLYVSESMPGSEVQFECSSGSYTVYFPGGSPFENLPETFSVINGTVKTGRLDPSVGGKTFYFEIQYGREIYDNLRIVVSPQGALSKVGFFMDKTGALSVQPFISMATLGKIDVSIANATSNDAEIEISQGSNINPSTVDLGPHGVDVVAVSPGKYGKCATLALKSKLRGIGTQSGGTMQADIFVEPPPTDELPTRNHRQRSLREKIRALRRGAIQGGAFWLGESR